MSEILLIRRRPAPHQRAVPSPVAPPHPAAVAQPAVVVRPVPVPSPPAVAQPCFAARNSPIDLLFRALWQMVGAYVFLVLLIKDHKLPR